MSYMDLDLGFDDEFDYAEEGFKSGLTSMITNVNELSGILSGIINVTTYAAALGISVVDMAIVSVFEKVRFTNGIKQLREMAKDTNDPKKKKKLLDRADRAEHIRDVMSGIHRKTPLDESLNKPNIVDRVFSWFENISNDLGDMYVEHLDKSAKRNAAKGNDAIATQQKALSAYYKTMTKESAGELDFDNLLIDDDDYDAYASEATLEGYDDYENTELTEAAEAAYFLDAFMSECDSLEEFQAAVMENAVDWQMYGLIPDATAAMEAVKKITIQDWRAVNFDRLWHRECIRLAKENNDPNYKKYAIARAKMKAARAPIFQKYETKAKTNVRAALRNSKAKASNINSNSGKRTATKMDRAIKKIDINSSYNKSINGQNPSRTKHPTNVASKTHRA